MLNKLQLHLLPFFGEYRLDEIDETPEPAINAFLAGAETPGDSRNKGRQRQSERR